MQIFCATQIPEDFARSGFANRELQPTYAAASGIGRDPASGAAGKPGKNQTAASTCETQACEITVAQKSRTQRLETFVQRLVDGEALGTFQEEAHQERPTMRAPLVFQLRT